MALLTLTGRVDCATCEEPIEGVWRPEADSLEDIGDIPEAELTCPNGHTQWYEYPGWRYWTEAG